MVAVSVADVLGERVGEGVSVFRGVWAQPDAEPVGVNVVGAEDVAGAGAAVVVGALPLGLSGARTRSGGNGRVEDCPSVALAHSVGVC